VDGVILHVTTPHVPFKQSLGREGFGAQMTAMSLLISCRILGTNFDMSHVIMFRFEAFIAMWTGVRSFIRVGLFVPSKITLRKEAHSANLADERIISIVPLQVSIELILQSELLRTLRALMH
jgi:hypothetical protein